MALLSTEKVNTGRQPELDLARGFSALLLVFCHVGLYLGDNNDNAIYTFADIIGSEFAAPVFMTLMGISLVYSKRQQPLDLLRRGIRLLLLGYLLSFYRSFIPSVIFGKIDEWSWTDAFFVVDIFQFAGLSFILLSLLKWLKMPSWGMLILSLAFVSATQIYIYLGRPFDLDEKWAYLINLFLPVTDWSCFPFFIWFFFPAFGQVLGEVLTHCNNKNLFYGILLPISLCAVVYVYCTFIRLYPNYTSYYYGGNFYYMGLGNVLLNALFITFAMSFWHFVGKILPKFIAKFLTFMGQNITMFYVFSWLIISPLIHINALFEITYSRVVTIVMMFATTAVCYLCTKIYKAITTKHKNKTAEAQQ